MTPPAGDPYAVLGVAPTATDAELRTAYRRLVRETHPDLNGGSVESARRFEAVQDAYALIQQQRRAGQTSRTAGSSARSATSATSAPYSPPRPASTSPSDAAVDARIAQMEAELKAAREATARAEEARARAAQAAREAAAAAAVSEGKASPSDEDLGYIHTEDSVGKILADAESQLSERWSKSSGRPFSQRLVDLFGDDS